MSFPNIQPLAWRYPGGLKDLKFSGTLGKPYWLLNDRLYRWARDSHLQSVFCVVFNQIQPAAQIKGPFLSVFLFHNRRVLGMDNVFFASEANEEVINLIFGAQGLYIICYKTPLFF